MGPAQLLYSPPPLLRVRLLWGSREPIGRSTEQKPEESETQQKNWKVEETRSPASLLRLFWLVTRWAERLSTHPLAVWRRGARLRGKAWQGRSWVGRAGLGLCGRLLGRWCWVVAQWVTYFCVARRLYCWGIYCCCIVSPGATRTMPPPSWSSHRLPPSTQTAPPVLRAGSTVTLTRRSSFALTCKLPGRRGGRRRRRGPGCLHVVGRKGEGRGFLVLDCPPADPTVARRWWWQVPRCSRAGGK
jgi:hypothetical protein